MYRDTLAPPEVRTEEDLVARAKHCIMNVGLTPLIGASVLALTLLYGLAASAAPVTYQIDPEHTYPSFEADHMGLSVWRGKFNRSSGWIVLDKDAGRGSLEVMIETASIDFGHDRMNEVAKGTDLFDTARFPQASYSGKLDNFVGGVPSRVVGDLTLRGVTHAVPLDIASFKCVPHPFFRLREVCGADATGSFRRDEFGIDAGRLFGFDMRVALRIQVEAIEIDNAPKPRAPHD